MKQLLHNPWFWGNAAYMAMLIIVLGGGEAFYWYLGLVNGPWLWPRIMGRSPASES